MPNKQYFKGGLIQPVYNNGNQLSDTGSGEPLDI
jgi:hypothetical protein